ncbi:putative reverse transcriptase domain-containing protein, partial [Tanacetum coccineum]
MANLPPPNHVADLLEDDMEEQPELAPEPNLLNEFAPHQIPQPEGNMNGWIIEDDEEEEEEEDPEMEEEMEEENDDDDAKFINPYKEADPLNLPPPDSDTESEDKAVAPTSDDHKQEAEANTVGKITMEGMSTLYIARSRRTQTNPQPTLTREAAERERVRMEATRAGGPAGGPAAAPVAQECSFMGFMKCGPTQFHGNEGVVELYRWFEKIESVFGINECAERSKVKFGAATLQGRALTWWNSQVATLGLDVDNGKSWTDMRKMMMEEFCLDEVVQRLENELRSLKLRDTNIAAYTQWFNELALLCPEAVLTEKKKVELYIKGLPENIKGETTSSRPTMLNEAIRMAHTLMEQKLQAKAERIAEGNKRKWENNNNNNNNNNNRRNYRNNNYHNQNNNQRHGNA